MSLALLAYKLPSHELASHPLLVECMLDFLDLKCLRRSWFSGNNFEKARLRGMVQESGGHISDLSKCHFDDHVFFLKIVPAK